jgi:hypothetical protein
MRKLILVVFAAVLALPALAVAGSPPSPADKAAAAKQCATLMTNMGAAPFKALYGTNANKSNAFGKCVSTNAQKNEQDRSNAAAACRTERSADPAAFAAKYGKGSRHDGAFGNCVSQKAKAAAAARVDATVNAAKSCWSERKADPAAFKAKYGTNADKSNAFGKCVSGKVKHSSS